MVRPLPTLLVALVFRHFDLIVQQLPDDRGRTLASVELFTSKHAIINAWLQAGCATTTFDNATHQSPIPEHQRRPGPKIALGVSTQASWNVVGRASGCLLGVGWEVQNQTGAIAKGKHTRGYTV